MTRKFNIIVDGVAHEVEVEELGGSAAPVSAPAARIFCAVITATMH